MKKKYTILTSSFLAVGVLLASMNVHASEKVQDTVDIKQFESTYNGNAQVALDDSSPNAVGSFVVGALVGGVIYDAAKAAVDKYNQMTKDSTYIEKYDAKNVGYAGPLSRTEDNSAAFGRD